MAMVEDQPAPQAKVEFHFPIWRASRRKLSPDHPFFTAGNVERELLAKQITLEISEEEKRQISCLEEEQCWETVCPVVGCNAKLIGLHELEAHYFSRHTAICSVCSRVFPTSRLLDLHVSEAHDSFFQAKAARGHPMYICLVDGCDTRFHSDSSRHQHLVDKHKFPQSFRFHQRRHLSQKQRQRQHTRQSSKKTQDQHAKVEVAKKRIQDSSSSHEEPENAACSMDVDVLTAAVSRLTTTDNIPSTVTFGRRHRAFAFIPNNARQRGRGRGRGRGSRHAIRNPNSCSNIVDEQQASLEQLL